MLVQLGGDLSVGAKMPPAETGANVTGASGTV